MANERIRLTGNNDHVEVTPGEDDAVTLKLGDGVAGITVVGRRYDVHRLILEADKQLARLAFPLY